MKCAIVLYDAGRSEEAAEEIEGALAATAAGKCHMSSGARAQGRHLFGAAYATLVR